jgi:hypothetical protein
MDDLPGMEATAEKCRQLIGKLKQMAERAATQTETPPQQANILSSGAKLSGAQPTNIAPTRPNPFAPPPGSFTADTLTLEPIDKDLNNGNDSSKGSRDLPPLEFK